MSQKLLEIQNVSKIFRIGGMLMGKKLVANDDISLSIDAGKPVILSIVGESGCGKSTLCKMILRLYNPDMGDIKLMGKSYKDKRSYDPKQFKLDVQPIDRLGEVFDPNLESAVLQGSPDEGEPGTVCAVLQKGYTMGKSVLRYAMVKVVPE